jgi:hypothetical protein
MELPTHPRLLFNPEGIAQLKKRIASYDWAQARWQESPKALKPMPANPVERPRSQVEHGLLSLFDIIALHHRYNKHNDSSQWTSHGMMKGQA